MRASSLTPPGKAGRSPGAADRALWSRNSFQRLMCVTGTGPGGVVSPSWGEANEPGPQALTGGFHPLTGPPISFSLSFSSPAASAVLDPRMRARPRAGIGVIRLALRPHPDSGSASRGGAALPPLGPAFWRRSPAWPEEKKPAPVCRGAGFDDGAAGTWFFGLASASGAWLWAIGAFALSPPESISSPPTAPGLIRRRIWPAPQLRPNLPSSRFGPRGADFERVADLTGADLAGVRF